MGDTRGVEKMGRMNRFCLVYFDLFFSSSYFFSELFGGVFFDFFFVGVGLV